MCLAVIRLEVFTWIKPESMFSVISEFQASSVHVVLLPYGAT